MQACYARRYEPALARLIVWVLGGVGARADPCLPIPAFRRLSPYHRSLAAEGSRYRGIERSGEHLSPRHNYHRGRDSGTPTPCRCRSQCRSRMARRGNRATAQPRPTGRTSQSADQRSGSDATGQLMDHAADETLRRNQVADPLYPPPTASPATSGQRAAGHGRLGALARLPRRPACCVPHDQLGRD